MPILLRVALAVTALCLLSGCAVVDVAGAAVDVTATAVTTTVDVGSAVIDTAADTVSGGSDEKKKSD
jgi:hypothetical protein